MSVEVDLSGRVAVVTGGGGGIGGAVSAVLAAAGAHVVIAEVDGERAQQTEVEIVGRGDSAQAYVIDVRERGPAWSGWRPPFCRPHGRVWYLR